MQRLALFLVALVAWQMGGFSISRAAVRPYQKLTLTECIDLQNSERRLIIYDYALEALDASVRRKKISREEYGYEKRDLMAFIAGEAKYQNDILTKDSGFAEDAREVMQNIARYTTLFFGGVLYLAAHGFSGTSVSP